MIIKAVIFISLVVSTTFIRPALAASFQIQGEYIVFPTRLDTVEWISEAIRSNKLPSDLLAGRVLQSEDPSQVRAEELLSKVWRAARGLFAESHDLPVPQVLVIQGGSITNGMSGIDANFMGKTLHLVMISSCFFEQGVDDGKIMGIMAHEIGHLLKRHSAGDPPIKAYRVTQENEKAMILDPVVDENPEWLAPLFKWFLESRLVGAINHQALLGLPAVINETSFYEKLDLAGSSMNLYWNVLKHALRTYANEPLGVKPVCDEARASLSQYVEWMTHKFSAQYDRSLYSFTADDVAEMNSFAGKLREALIGCLGSVKKDWAEMIAETLEIPVNQVRREELVIRSESFIFDLFENVEAIREKMRNLEAQVDLPSIRMSTAEDEADDIGVKIMHGLGFDVEVFVDMLASVDPTLDRAACEKVLSTGKIPSIGELTDLHHRTCYRIFRARGVAERWRHEAQGVRDASI